MKDWKVIHIINKEELIKEQVKSEQVSYLISSYLKLLNVLANKHNYQVVNKE